MEPAGSDRQPLTSTAPWSPPAARSLASTCHGRDGTLGFRYGTPGFHQERAFSQVRVRFKIGPSLNVNHARHGGLAHHLPHLRARPARRPGLGRLAATERPAVGARPVPTGAYQRRVLGLRGPPGPACATWPPRAAAGRRGLSPAREAWCCRWWAEVPPHLRRWRPRPTGCRSVAEVDLPAALLTPAMEGPPPSRLRRRAYARAISGPCTHRQQGNRAPAGGGPEEPAGGVRKGRQPRSPGATRRGR